MRARGPRELGGGAYGAPSIAPTDAARVPFGRSWLKALEPLVIGVAVDRPSAANGWIQLVCRDADRVRPWAIEVLDGRIHSIAPIVRSDAVNVVVHSVTVGWRLLGLSVRGFHRLNELVLEQRSEGRWRRHPIPPLDDAMIDLSHAETREIMGWSERVIDSPIGTLYVGRRVDRGLLRVCGASTRPPLSCEGVASDVAWSDLMRLRQRSAHPGAWNSRVWRGDAASVGVVRAALSQARPDTHGLRVLRITRDRAFLDALAALDGMRGVLRGDTRWRELWQPSARPPRS